MKTMSYYYVLLILFNVQDAKLFVAIIGRSVEWASLNVHVYNVKRNIVAN